MTDQAPSEPNNNTSAPDVTTTTTPAPSSSQGGSPPVASSPYTKEQEYNAGMIAFIDKKITALEESKNALVSGEYRHNHIDAIRFLTNLREKIKLKSDLGIGALSPEKANDDLKDLWALANEPFKDFTAYNLDFVDKQKKNLKEFDAQGQRLPPASLPAEETLYSAIIKEAKRLASPELTESVETAAVIEPTKPKLATASVGAKTASVKETKPTIEPVKTTSAAVVEVPFRTRLEFNNKVIGLLERRKAELVGKQQSWRPGYVVQNAFGYRSHRVRAINELLEQAKALNNQGLLIEPKELKGAVINILGQGHSTNLNEALAGYNKDVLSKIQEWYNAIKLPPSASAPTTPDISEKDKKAIEFNNQVIGLLERRKAELESKQQSWQPGHALQNMLGYRNERLKGIEALLEVAKSLKEQKDAQGNIAMLDSTNLIAKATGELGMSGANVNKAFAGYNKTVLNEIDSLRSQFQASATPKPSSK